MRTGLDDQINLHIRRSWLVVLHKSTASRRCGYLPNCDGVCRKLEYQCGAPRPHALRSTFAVRGSREDTGQSKTTHIAEKYNERNSQTFFWDFRGGFTCGLA
ncbi:unnamed protein product [Hapterophycus canaliculatus]